MSDERPRVATAAIVVIGDEILSGKFADENAVHLIGELRALGVALRRVEVIPDDVEEIAATVRAASARVDHVFTSGGVGPTHDDLTMAGIARAFGVPVVRHAELERLLCGFYGAALEPRNLRMAEVPEGATLHVGSASVWPVPQIANVYILPGVPVIFRRQFEVIRERFRAAPFHLRRVFCRAEEGTIAADLDAVVAGHASVTIGSYPRFGEGAPSVLVTLEAKDERAVEEACRALVARLPVAAVVRVE